MITSSRRKKKLSPNDWFTVIILLAIFGFTLRSMLMINALGQLTFAVAHRAADILDELEESIESPENKEQTDVKKWRDWDGIA